MRKITVFTLAVILGCLWASAEVCRITNEPNSVYLFSYVTAQDEGKSGLKFAWSPDGERWLDVADGFGYLKCDFGAWGKGKRMFRLRLMQSRADGSWHCLWAMSASGEAMAYASSPDLLKWKPQTYFPKGEEGRYISVVNTVPAEERMLAVRGAEQSGWVQRVPYAVVEELIRFAEQKKYRQAQYAECAAQDAVRFAGLQPVEATLRVDAGQGKPISDRLLGIFFEDINYAADGGLYAELVQNRDFEYAPADRGYSPERWTEWGALTAWGGIRPRSRGAANKVPLHLQIDTVSPLHPNNPHYLKVMADMPGAGLYNTGYDGIAVKKGERYDFSFFARLPEEGYSATGRYPQRKTLKLTVRLTDKHGGVCAEATVKVTSCEWKKYTVVLTAVSGADSTRLELFPQAVPSTLHVDMVSLFPRNTFRGRANGLRADLAQTLADLCPRFVRFPGGCVAHGDGVDNIYDWKGSIGALEARKPLRNLWGYHQTRGLGYYEFFQFCEDIGAEPLPVVAAGVPCQNSATCSRHSKGEIGCAGQQGGIPREKMGQYVQDVLDLIEWANGDPRRTKWGRVRAEAGHPEPFRLKYIGIGNEDLISDVFRERFTMLFDAVRAKYPDVTVIGTTGPFYEGSDYDEGWELASKMGVPMVDEHYYVSPGWFIHNQDFYDRYDRRKSKVYLGEYAAHLPGRPANMETALAEALYLTAVERNGDIVSMASYAPLLAKEGHTQWNPDLIYFNNTEVKPTPGYYVQQMFGCNAGDEYLPSVVSLDRAEVAFADNGKRGVDRAGKPVPAEMRDAVKKRIATSVVRDSKSGDLIVKLVNLLPVPVRAGLHLPLPEGRESVTAVRTLLAGSPADKQTRPVTDSLTVAFGFPYEMPPYSFTVLRIADEKDR